MYADVRHITDDSMELCQRLLAETGVASSRALIFDTIDGGHFLRLSFAGKTDDITEALTRLASFDLRAG